MRGYGRFVDTAAGTTIVVGDERLDNDGLRAAVADAARSYAGVPVMAVVAEPTMRTVITVLAGIEAGCTVVPMSPDAGPREHDHVLVDSGASLLVDRDGMHALAPTPLAPSPSVPLVLYTSGTTGPPKGVPITQAAIDACLDGLAAAWAWTPDDVLVHGLPLHHVHGLVLGVLGPLHVGSGLHHAGRATPVAYAAAAASGGSLYFGVPTVWSRIAADRASASALSRARLLVSGSAALPGPVFDALVEQCGQAPVERYGMTETLITLAARADELRLRGSVGRPLPGVEARILDDHGLVAPTGTDGTLEVRGSSVFDGYLHRPDATAAAFTADGWFRTGDVAQADPQGRFRIVGRAATDLIKSGGYRIGAGEVEDALLSHPAVTEAAVIGAPDDDLGQRIVAFVVADGVDEAALITHVATTLSWHKRPRAIVFVDALPRNAMGKVDKSRLAP
jgi:fatty acid CoA ligase FadD36